MASGGPGAGTVIFISALTSALVSTATVIGIQRAGIDLSGAPAGAPEMAEVPPLVGLPLSAARELLGARRLTMVIESKRPDTERPLDTVVEQKPLAGSRVSANSQVSVVVSAGAPRASVPELAGVRLEDARLMLAHAGLEVGEITKTDQGEPGAVTAVDPPAGSALEPGAAVALTVAEPKVEVPRVIGKHIAQAREMLEQAGFVVGKVSETYHRRRRGYVVLEQTPKAGSEVAPGSEIALIINQGE